MADKNEVVEVSVSLPARGFEMDTLQVALDAAAKQVKPDDAPNLVEEAMQAAVRVALPEGQPTLDVDPATMPGYAVIQVSDENGGVQEMRVFVPEDLKPAQLEGLMEASVDGVKIIDAKGRAVPIPEGDLAADIAAPATIAPKSGAASKGN